MQNVPGTMILLVGESGVGKTALVEAVLAADRCFSHLPGTTTRLPRPGEEGKHRFISVDQFEALARDDAFVAQFRFAGNQYGLTKSDVEEALAQGVVVATSAPCYVEALRACVERVVVVEVVPVGEWKRREGRELADREERPTIQVIDVVLENRFPDGFEEAKQILLSLCQTYV